MNKLIQYINNNLKNKYVRYAVFALLAIQSFLIAAKLISLFITSITFLLAPFFAACVIFLFSAVITTFIRRKK